MPSVAPAQAPSRPNRVTSLQPMQPITTRGLALFSMKKTCAFPASEAAGAGAFFRNWILKLTFSFPQASGRRVAHIAATGTARNAQSRRIAFNFMQRILAVRMRRVKLSHPHVKHGNGPIIRYRCPLTRVSACIWISGSSPNPRSQCMPGSRRNQVICRLA